MLFGHYGIDKTIDEHLSEIAALASDPQTIVFFDTNILSYLYKLHEAARREFFSWCDPIAAEDRLVIPAWAANEYLSRVTSNELDSYTPKGKKEPSIAKKALDALYETASQFVDDFSLRRVAFAGDRTAFLTGFRQAIDALNQYTGVFSQQFDSGIIHQQIVEHLSSTILGSDLAALCTRASHEGNERFGHRLPPGFRDEGKPENRFGDLIIWYEILDKSLASAASFPKVLFISRDEKSDWVYAPAKRVELVRGTRKSVGNSNPEIKLADPRLINEFGHKVGHTNFMIASLATLVEGLSKSSPAQFAHLAAAIQINIQESTPALPVVAEEVATPASEDGQPPTPEVPIAAPGLPVVVQREVEAPIEHPLNPPVEPVEPAAPRLHYELEALQDSQYQGDAPSDINTIIRALKSLNWYTQNPAIAKIRAIRQEDFPPSSWFVLGRNIYQAACGNSQKAMEFLAELQAQLRQFPVETAQHLLAGMLYEIYFDAQGEFRDAVKFSYADKPLALVTDEAYEETLEFITFHLRGHRQRLKFMPGDKDRKTIRIVSAPVAPATGDALVPIENTLNRPTSEIRSVIFEGIELMRDAENADENAWARMLRGAKLSPELIRDKISDELAIPKWALAIETAPMIRADLELVIPESREIHPELVLPTM
jgi:hypothetical protein